MPNLRAKALELAIQAAPLVRGGSGMRSMPPITDLDLFSDAKVILQWLMTGKTGAGNSTEAG